MWYKRESGRESYSCRAQLVVQETILAASLEEAELLFEERLDALEDDPALRVQGMWVE
ncbi:hypothetical protein [Eubacterium sp. 1001713B170207_170306_E7]|uniref:hypothetical protein n=1 Tax=Eubacterium sp. 1001713B170207_170306_E7 TaxID=2787097 RepID=UPI00189C26D3|nr:hypothetical protein [Eubacterium sp. 1001713B170207_170306_E7]